MPPVMVGIVLLASASLSNRLAYRYYLDAPYQSRRWCSGIRTRRRDRASSTDSATAVASSASA